MKTPFSIFIFCLCMGSITAQSWEVFFTPKKDGNNPFPLYDSRVYPAPNGGVRLAINQGWFEDAVISDFSSNGAFLDSVSNPAGNNKSFLHADNDGNTFWEFYKGIEKYDPQYNRLWRFKTNSFSGIYWTYHFNNGRTSMWDYDTLQVLDPQGQILFSFNWNDVPEHFVGADNSFFYKDLNCNTSNSCTWTKLKQNGQTAWSKAFGGLDILSVFSNGNIFAYHNYGVTMLNPAGDTVWVKNFTAPLSNAWVDNVQVLERKNGSAIVQFLLTDWSKDSNTLYTGQINQTTGEFDWLNATSEELANEYYINEYSDLSEMPDGGILSSISLENQNMPVDPFLLIIRTDPFGKIARSTIAGKLTRDFDLDCQTDFNEPGLNQFLVKAEAPGKKFTQMTDANGNFSFSVSPGTYALTASGTGSYWQTCQLPDSVAVNTLNDTANIALSIQTIANCPEMVVSVASPVFRRCFDNNYLYVQYSNVGTASAQNASVEITLDSKLEFLNASAPILSQVGQVFLFDIGNLTPNTGGNFYINFKVDCNAAMGELLCVSSSIFPDTSCVPTAVAKLTTNRFCLPVVASFDPNDKTAFVGGVPNIQKLDPEAPIEYMIRFQNTGNDTAFTIVVLDTLSNAHDAAYIVPGASSHPYRFDLKEGRILSFKFANILLPDSTTNEPRSHGFVKFYIRQSASNVIGTKLQNQAGIYFDFNDPIYTNTTKVEVSLPSATFLPGVALSATISPTPAKHQVRVHLHQTLSNCNWKLYDSTGKQVQKGDEQQPFFTIQRNTLPSGIYLCKVQLADGKRGVFKVVFE
jgi:Secretion system C-terminal sorting domain